MLPVLCDLISPPSESMQPLLKVGAISLAVIGAAIIIFLIILHFYHKKK